MKSIRWNVETLDVECGFMTEPKITAGIVGSPIHPNCRCSFDKILDDLMKKLNGDIAMKPEIKKVIFNNPATVILWKDGTKTVVKCQEGDTFDKEKGFALAYLKKLLGNDNTFNKVIKKWVK